MSTKRPFSPPRPSGLAAKHEDDVLTNQVAMMGGRISPKEFYVNKRVDAPPGQKFHGLLMQPSARTSVFGWNWGTAPATQEQGSLHGPLVLELEHGGDPPHITFWSIGPGVRPNIGGLPPGENMLLISQDTFAHMLPETTAGNTDPFPELPSAGTSIDIVTYDRMTDGSIMRQRVHAFVIPNSFMNALAEL